MKCSILFSLIVLIFYNCSTPDMERNPFQLSDKEIQKAIEHGLTTEYTYNAFGGIDTGLNTFMLGENAGYLDLLTPYVRVVHLSMKNKN